DFFGIETKEDEPETVQLPANTNEEPVAEALENEPKDEVKATETEPIGEEPEVGPAAGEASVDLETPVANEDEIELIKAPKIVLPGLTVKGKIDLPAPKSKEKSK